MRFAKYINEADISGEEWERIQETLKKRCMPFLKEFDYPVFRGYKPGKDFTRRPVRKDRKPRFIPEDIHEDLDQTLYNMFGWYPRSNGLFVADGVTARWFSKSSTVYHIFPVGDYQYIWTDEYKKLYSLYDEVTYFWNQGMELDNVYKRKKNEILDIAAKIYKSRGLSDVNEETSYEAIFNCESYYMLNTSIIGEEVVDFMESI